MTLFNNTKICILILCILFVSCKEQNTKKVQCNSYARKCAVFKEIPLPEQGTFEILFLGHSWINEFLLDEFIPHPDTISYCNMGIGGDEIHGVYNRSSLAFARKPRLIVLEIGINDFLNSVPLDTMQFYYLKLLDKAKEHNQKMLVCSIAPNTKIYSKQIEYFNKWLKMEVINHDFEYLDIYTPFQKDGGLSPEYDSGDETHINGKGYKLWSSLLKPYLW